MNILVVILGVLCLPSLDYASSSKGWKKSIALPDLFKSLSVESTSNNFIDESGRIRIFHGVNFIKKEHPWYHEELLNSRYAKDLASWGLNVVRLGVMWSGIEPQEGNFNSQYMSKIRKIVKNFENFGISVILDMHQDVVSSHFNTYDGFPLWLVNKLRNGTKQSFPWPLASVTSWFCGYLTYEVCDVYQKFYDNEHHALDMLARMWKYVARNVKDQRAVIGYNVINEPWAGNIYKDGSLILPSEVGRKNLEPMYEKLNKAIRTVDVDRLFFWDSASWSYWGLNSLIQVNQLILNFFGKFPALTWMNGISSVCGPLDLKEPDKSSDFCASLGNSQQGSPSKLLTPLMEEADCFDMGGKMMDDSIGKKAFGSGLQEVPGGSQYQNKSVMSWHYYFPLLVASVEGSSGHTGSDPFPWWQRILAHTMFGPTVFRNVRKEMVKIGGGRFLTEFGVCKPDASRKDHWGTVECEYVLRMADKDQLSWCYWDTYNLGVLWKGGQSILNSAKVLSRPYPMAVAGTNLQYTFNTQNYIFDMEFQANPSNSPPTLIFVPYHFYKGDPEIISSDDIDFRFSEFNTQVLEVRSTGSARKSWLVIGVRGQVHTDRPGTPWWLAPIQTLLGRVQNRHL